MLVFGVHEGERVAVDVPIGATVGEVKKLIQVWYSFLIALVLFALMLYVQVNNVSVMSGPFHVFQG